MFSKKLLATSVSAVTLALAGCGASDQDSGSSSNNVQLSGLVVDPYVAQAKVYVDLNNNGVHEYGNFEAFAFTDEDGYFSTDKEGNSYCDKSAATYNARHCLNTSQLSSNAVLRIEGGFDVATGQKFKGSMALDLDLNNASAVTNTGVANPLTALFAATKELNSTQRTAILNFLGYAAVSATQSEIQFAESLTSDFMDSSDSTKYSAERFKKAMAVHKSVAILSRAIEKKYDGKIFGQKVGADKTLMPSSAGKFVYEALATKLADLNGTAPAVGDWNQVLRNAETAVRKVYTNAGGTGLVAAYLATDGAAVGLDQRVAALYTWFDGLPVTALKVETTSTAAEKTEAKAVLERLARLADVTVGVVEKEISGGTITNDGGGNAKGLLDAITPATDLTLNTTTGKTDKLANLEEKVDIATVITTVSGGSSDIQTAATNATLDATNRFFDAGQTTAADQSKLATERMRLTLADDVATTEDNEASAAEFYFVGADGATSGTFKACVKTASKKGGDLDEISANGAYIEGRWSRLTDYSVNISVTKPVSPEDSLVVKVTKTAGTYSFSLNGAGEPKSWTGELSTNGSYGGNSIPSTDADCSTVQLP